MVHLNSNERQAYRNLPIRQIVTEPIEISLKSWLKSAFFDKYILRFDDGFFMQFSGTLISVCDNTFAKYCNTLADYDWPDCTLNSNK